jgi:glycosyltransferase involved in cell wall biosynthesis
MSDEPQWPLISVCIVSFNRLEYLRETLDTFRQCCTYPHLEYILTDNGSEPEVVEYIDSLNFLDHKIMNEKNMGHGHAMNQARRIAKGEYFFNLENDFSFFYRSDWLERGVRLIERDRKGEQIPKHPAELPLGFVKFELGAEMADYTNRPGLMPKSVFRDVGEYTQVGREYSFVSESFGSIEKEYIRRFGSKYASTLSETPCCIHIGGNTTNPLYGNKGRRSYKELDDMLRGRWKNGKWWLTYNYEKLVKKAKIRTALRRYKRFEATRSRI